MDILAAQERAFNQALDAQAQKFNEALSDLRREVRDLKDELDDQSRYVESTIEDQVEQGLAYTQASIMQTLTRGHMRATIFLESPDCD